MLNEKRCLEELLKLCYDQGNLIKLDKLFSKVNVDNMAEITRALGLESFIYHTIHFKNIINHIPKKYYLYLQKGSGLIAIKNKFIQREAKIILDIFNKENIDYIVVKGIATAGRIYNSSTIRAISDIDILIKKDQYGKLKKLLNSNNYYFTKEILEKLNSNYNQKDVEEKLSEICFVKTTKPYNIHLDIHFDLSGFSNKSRLRDLYPDYGKWFENKKEIIVEDFKLYGLNLQTELLNMIYHFSVHHSFLGVKWLIDLCQIFKNHSSSIDLKQLKINATTKHQKKLLAICLRMVEDIIGSDSFKVYNWGYFYKLNSLEYSIYKKMIFENLHSFKSKIYYRIVKLLLPVSFIGKFKLIKFYFFDTSSIQYRLNKEKKISGITLPLHLLKITIEDYKRGKNGTKK